MDNEILERYLKYLKLEPYQIKLLMFILKSENITLVDTRKEGYKLLSIKK